MSPVFRTIVSVSISSLQVGAGFILSIHFLSSHGVVTPSFASAKSPSVEQWSKVDPFQKITTSTADVVVHTSLSVPVFQRPIFSESTDLQSQIIRGAKRLSMLWRRTLGKFEGVEHPRQELLKVRYL